MPINQCSKCRKEGHVLEEVSREAWVDYYRCQCGHVWTVARNGQRERFDVTTYQPESIPPAEAQTAVRPSLDGR